MPHLSLCIVIQESVVGHGTKLRDSRGQAPRRQQASLPGLSPDRGECLQEWPSPGLGLPGPRESSNKTPALGAKIK